MAKLTSDPILDELRQIKKLLALQHIACIKTKQEKVTFLLGCGLQPTAVADVLGVEPKYVSAVVSNLKRRGKHGRNEQADSQGTENSDTAAGDSRGGRQETEAAD